MTIRLARPEDAAAVVALRALVYPYLVRGVASTRQMIAEPPPSEPWTAFVAEVDGTVVGWVSAYRVGTTSERGVGSVSLLHVRGDQRGRGLGSGLLAAALAHLLPLGVRRVQGWAAAEGLDFARRHGFTTGREMRYSALELRPVPPPPAAPPHVRLSPLTDVDPHQVYLANRATAVDEPGDVSRDAISYESFRYEIWNNLGLDREASTAVESDGKVLAFSLVKRDGDRMWSDYTATVPEHRGRGLARLAKTAALHRAAATGVRVAYTSNDAANAPMLTINEGLGYRPVASQWSCLRELR
ncbi:GNAT family N-acetyltransferase [Micromonospora sp. RTGN7]|uniref:GNAT family N-acetyltransferase n=1 Tax=Micromonospora sp. RTGN7 TaxID=3016526 RepID=UPI0029FF180B|nr:GNAT family N-acetyltransferase [Micromonospora sp. RTGN7]